MIQKFALLIAIILILGCNASKENRSAKTDIDSVVENQETYQQESLEQQILGSWQWWKTICCFRRPVTTLAKDSLQEPYILHFKRDGTVEYFKGEELKRTSSYTVSYGLMDDDRPVLRFDGGRAALLNVHGDTLIIDYGYMDLQTEFYLREE